MNKKLIVLWAVRAILIALILCWMAIIFGFSAADGAESSSFSDKITIRVVQFLETDYEDLTVVAQEKLFHKVSFVVRKTGHFVEYGILAVLWILLLLSFEKIRNLKKYMILMLPIMICFAYAATDEFHQGFVDGRTPKILDVMIDTFGGFAGAGVILMIWLIFRRKNEQLGTKC